MGDVLFSIFISLVWFANLIIVPTTLLVLPLLFTSPQKIDPSFIRQIIMQSVLFLGSALLVFLNLKLAGMKMSIVKYTLYIFAIPIVGVMGLLIWLILDIFRNPEFLLGSEGEGALGLLIAGGTIILGLAISVAYFVLIRERILSKLKNDKGRH